MILSWRRRQREPKRESQGSPIIWRAEQLGLCHSHHDALITFDPIISSASTSPWPLASSMVTLSTVTLSRATPGCLPSDRLKGHQCQLDVTVTARNFSAPCFSPHGAHKDEHAA